MLINANLTRPQTSVIEGIAAPSACVAFLDLDPGQPEYSPPGDLSLILIRTCNLGPPFTHPIVGHASGNQLIRAHHLGFLSPKDYPTHYVKCAINLLSHYRMLRAQYPSCSLIINSAGWIQGTGLETLLDIVQSQELSDIVYTSTRGPPDAVFPLSEAAQSVRAQLHFLDSQDSISASHNAKTFRQMQTFSYFHLDKPEMGNLRWNSIPLTQHIPMTIHWAGDKQDIFAVNTYCDDVDPEHLITILSGCIVAIVVIEDDRTVLGQPGLHDERTHPGLNGPNSGSTEVSKQATLAVARLESFESSDSESQSVGTSASSFDPGRRDSTKFLTQCVEDDSDSGYLHHPSIKRTSLDMPYINYDKGTLEPLNPSKSYSVGQALIQSINVQSRCFHILTPVPSEVMTSLHRQERKIVLIRGKLETPTWAYLEEWEQGASMRRQLRK